MPSIRPAIAVAYSQTTSCAPSEPLTSSSPSWCSNRWNCFASSTKRTICRSAGFASTSGETGSRTTGRMPVPSLPVDSATSCSIQSGRPTMCVPSRDEAQLVAPRGCAAGDRRGEDERGIVGAVDGHLEQRRLGLVEELGDVGAGETRRHQPEGGEGRVAAADGRVGVEDGVAVARGPPGPAASPGRSRRRCARRGRCPGRGTRPRTPAWRSRSRPSIPTSTTRPARCG